MPRLDNIVSGTPQLAAEQYFTSFGDHFKGIGAKWLTFVRRGKLQDESVVSDSPTRTLMSVCVLVLAYPLITSDPKPLVMMLILAP